jgi:transcriptional regulator GlxA family with amidase domain
MTDSKTIAFVLYPGLTPLDLIGPLQVLCGLPRIDPAYRIAVVGAQRQVHETDAVIGLQPSHTFAEVPDPFAIVVPGGGAATVRAMTNGTLLGYLRTAAEHTEIVTSVCTGSLILAAAGLLEGRRATTHWAFHDLLERLGARPVRQRWVEDGPYVTAAGVSAGLDMALHLAERLVGIDVARLIQLGLEYDPQPPFGPLDWSQAHPNLFLGLFGIDLPTLLAEDPALLARATGHTAAAVRSPAAVSVAS